MAATEQEQHSMKVDPKAADTIYVVLIREGDGAYTWADQVSARDAKDAVRYVTERLEKDGETPDPKVTFVAIPKRYWKELRAVTETHTTITIEDAA